MTKTTSSFLNLDQYDLLKGLLVAIISAVLVSIYPVLISHQLPHLSDVGYTAAIAGVAYLIKNAFTPSAIVTPVA